MSWKFWAVVVVVALGIAAVYVWGALTMIESGGR